jgi:DnaJ-class molecular chaperone
LKYHPDKQARAKKKKEKEEMARKFVQLQDAYAVLGDEDKRILYDTGEAMLSKASL